MDQLSKKTFQTSRSLTYTYYISPSSSPDADSSHPPLLLLHGWPDSAHLWSAVVPSLLKTPHQIVIPDLLGYGGTSKPTDPALYSLRAMTADLTELLSHEGITKCIPIGHDWGAYFAGRFYIWAPERVSGLALLNVAYTPRAPQPFDLQAILDFQEKTIGDPLFAYWEFFTAPDAPEVAAAHLESFWTAIHGADIDGKNWMREMFCVRGATRAHLLADKHVPLKPYAQDQGLRSEWIERMKRDGFAGPFCWYRALAENVVFEEEKELPEERFKIGRPLLFLGCTGDAVCRAEGYKMAQEVGLTPDLKVEVIESGHWCTFEKPEEVSRALVGFLEGTKFEYRMNTK